MHIIRLRGPWQIEPLDGSEPAASVETVIPGDWTTALGANYLGRARYIRKFGLPTNLTTERVYLVIESVAAAGAIELNGKSLGIQIAADGPRRYEVTGQLALRNELRIIVTPSDQPGGLGEVRLEIEDS